MPLTRPLAQLIKHLSSYLGQKRHPHAQTAVLVAAVFAAYLWLSSPALMPFAPQAFGVALLLFILSKRGPKNAKAWHILPNRHSFEMVVLSFAFLLMIGATGNTQSLLYPLSYAHLFLLAMTNRTSTTIITTSAIGVFHLALLGGVETATTGDLAGLIALPVLLVCFLLGRTQYLEVIKEKQQLIQAAHQLEDEAALLSTWEQTLERVITDLLQPKLKLIKQLLEEKETSAALTQLALIESELTKILSRAHEQLPEHEQLPKHNPAPSSEPQQTTNNE